MAQDDYNYPIRPLPFFETVGSNALSSVQSGAIEVGGPSVPAAALQSPFGNSDFAGGGGGSNPTCASNWQIGTITSSQINMPCTGSIQYIQTSSGIVITSGSKILELLLSAGDNRLFISTSSKSVTIDPDDLEDEAPDASFKEITGCHMGQAATRMVLCTDAVPI